MGRPKGSKNRPKVPPDESAAAAINGNGAAPGHDKKPAAGSLTEAQRQALALQHKAGYEAALAVKKAGDAKFKNACKLIKAEVGADGVDLIKDMLLAETEEGEAELKARIERALRAANYMAAPLGGQLGLLDDADRVPAVDQAKAEGRRDGMLGKTLHNPYDPSVPQHAAYAEGWHEGQAELFAIQRTEDGEAFDAADALPGAEINAGHESGEGATAH